MSDLPPCPFCGGKAEWVSGGPGCAYIKCKSCPAETSDGSVPRIAAAWNTRADLSAAERDAAVKAERERCAKIADTFHEEACKWAAVYVKEFDGKTDSARIAAAIREDTP